MSQWQERRRKAFAVFAARMVISALSMCPPRAAYNKTTVIEYEWEDIFQKRKSKGRSRRRGAGAYTLCKDCNSNTGSWYSYEYAKWSKICHDVMVQWGRTNTKIGTIFLYNVYPLRFLKQVVTCFFSVIGAPGGAVFTDNYPGLAPFILDKHNTMLSVGFRLFMNLYKYSDTGKTQLRRWPIMAKISVAQDTNGNLVPVNSALFDEIAHPPFQLIMTMENAPIQWATEITKLKNYGYDDQVNLGLQLRVVNSDSLYPGAS